jgi:hypothetical protein
MEIIDETVRSPFIFVERVKYYYDHIVIINIM